MKNKIIKLIDGILYVIFFSGLVVFVIHLLFLKEGL
jgi:magnesium-transporting ATPase (P-type)